MAARVDESTLHDTQFSPKGSLVYVRHPEPHPAADLQRGLPGRQLLGVLPARRRRRRADHRPRPPPSRTPSGRSSAAHRSASAQHPGPRPGQRRPGGRGDQELRARLLGDPRRSKLYLTIDYYQSDDRELRHRPAARASTRCGNPTSAPTRRPRACRRRSQAADPRRPAGRLRRPRSRGSQNLRTGSRSSLWPPTPTPARWTRRASTWRLNYYVTDKLARRLQLLLVRLRGQGAAAPGDQLLPNAPGEQVRAWASPTPATASAARSSTAGSDDFRWAAGVFVGDVPSYDVVDLGAELPTSTTTGRWASTSATCSTRSTSRPSAATSLSRRALGHVPSPGRPSEAGRREGI